MQISLLISSKLAFESLKQTKQNITFEQAIIKAENYCAYKERCISELRNKLRLLKVSESDAEKIIKLMLEKGFVNEERYIESFVRSKFKIKKWGSNKIKAELSKKGLKGQIVEKYISKIDEDKINEQLILLIEKKLNHSSYQKKDKQEKYQALYRYLLTKGYSSKEVALALKKHFN